MGVIIFVTLLFSNRQPIHTNLHPFFGGKTESAVSLRVAVLLSSVMVRCFV
jgi:hypothetical protein